MGVSAVFRGCSEIRVIKTSAPAAEVEVPRSRLDSVGRFTVCEDFEVHQPDLEKRGHKFG